MQTPSENRNERRCFGRHELSLDISLRAPGGKPMIGKLRSFSAEGCTIRRTGIAEHGARVWIRLPGLESQLGIVGRTSTQETQLNFCRPLHPAVTEAYVEAHSPRWQVGEWTQGRIRQLLNQRSELLRSV